MTIDKKKAARKAAAKYSANPVSATLEYANLTDQLESVTTDFERIKEEMLSELPLYRHPVNGKLSEYMIFFDPDCLKLGGRVLEQPVFIEALEKEGVADDVLTSAKKYAHESERRQIELAECRDELGELKSKLSEAQRIYEKLRDERSDKRNASVVRAIGLSTGSAPKRVDRKKVYFDYVRLVRKDGLPRYEAVKKIKEKYGLQGHNAAVKHLSAYRRTLFEFWEQNYPSTSFDVKFYLKGLVPNKKE
jgi:hypothetical protein